MNWKQWLKRRMKSSDRKRLPQEALLIDEVHMMYRIATEEAEVEMPEMKRWLDEEDLRIHRAKLSNRAPSPEEIIRRAKLIASTEELMATGVGPEEARTRVAELSGVDRDKVARLHREFDPKPLFTGDNRYRRNLPDKVDEVREWIRSKHNQLSVIDILKTLFGHKNKPPE